jgi:flagellar motor switch/type III secretory pathway protein FliN
MASPIQTAIEQEQEARWASVAGLPCQVAVELSIANLRVADILALAPGSLVVTQTLVASDVPLRVHGELVAWCEFEVVHDRLAVRLTELA